MRLLALVGLVLALLAAPASAQAGCSFTLGFKTIADQIPSSVGDCLENERWNPGNGNIEQRTAGGLLVWRKLDNFTAFTDGYRSWVNGPLGLQQRLNTEQFDWERATAPPPNPEPSALLRSICFQDVTNMLSIARSGRLEPGAGAQAWGEARCQESFVRDGNPGLTCFRFAYAQAILRVSFRSTSTGATFAQDYASLYSGCLGR